MSHFIHIKNRSSYSLACGAMHIHDMVEQAFNLNMPALGIMDKHNFFGSLEFSLACAQKSIQPIIGIEMNVN